MKRLGGCLIGLALGLVVAATGYDRLNAWVGATDLPPLVVETSVEVLDRNGQLLRAYTVDDGRWRLGVEFAAVDPAFLAMLVAYEDKRFYRHSGVDPRAFLRAIGQALWNGRVISGGSTLTMQVARLLEDGPTGRWQGKLRQIRVALALERQLTKAEILALYLNRAPYGGNLEGIRAATRAYFGKEPLRLTPAEIALLVGLPQSPTARRPDLHPERARDARAAVLRRARDAGVIDQGTLKAALRDPVPVRRIALPALAPHLSDRARIAAPTEGRHNLTLGASLQSQLEALSARAAADYGQRLSVAIVVLDHRNGEILASVGSAGYRGDARLGYVDMSRALRSPGSTLKPLVYGLAFDEGLAHPETLINDRPVRFGTYAPSNFDGTYRGPMKVREALIESRNIPVVSLTEALGPARLMAALRRAKVRAVLPGNAPAGLAVALGGVGVTLEDMVGLYASLGNQGRAVHVHYRQSDIGPAIGAKVLSPEAAWQIGNILSGMPAPPNAPRIGLAYKTGTSYGHRDTWAIGFDGAHVVGVWMGRADGTPVPGAFGADLAAPILFEAFARLKPDLTPLGAPPVNTLLLSHAALPAQLREFQPRDALFTMDADAPTLVFPPDGAVIETQGAPLVAKVENGTAPYTWLANGAPILVATPAKQAALNLAGPGFFTLSVIDATGRTARAQIQLK